MFVFTVHAYKCVFLLPIFVGVYSSSFSFSRLSFFKIMQQPLPVHTFPQSCFVDQTQSLIIGSVYTI